MSHDLLDEIFRRETDFKSSFSEYIIKTELVNFKSHQVNEMKLKYLMNKVLLINNSFGDIKTALCVGKN